MLLDSYLLEAALEALVIRRVGTEERIAHFGNTVRSVCVIGEAQPSIGRALAAVRTGAKSLPCTASPLRDQVPGGKVINSNRIAHCVALAE